MTPAANSTNRDSLLLTLGIVGAIAVLSRVSWEYPVTQWVLTRALGHLVVSSLWALVCLGSGLRVLGWLGFKHQAWSIRVALGFPLGVFAFGVLVFLCAVLGLFGSFAFFALPLCMGLVGARPLLDFGHRLAKSRFRRLTPLEGLAVAFGAVCLLLVYVPILTPQNVQHDARWYHLPIAAQYAASQFGSAFSEGWLLGAYPHFSSYLYAWCLAAPLPIVERLGIAAHLEFLLFVATLAAIPVAARCILPGRWSRMTWAVVFLFPGLFVYDSNLGTGADHITAFWAPAAFVALFLRGQAWFQRSCVLGLLAGATMLTKYSAACLAGPILLGGALLVPGRQRAGFDGQKSVRPALVVLTAFLVAWAPHWLNNWIHFQDPLYPLLSRYLPSRPWHADIARYFRQFEHNDLLRPSMDGEGLVQTVKSMLTVGFEVNEYNFHGNVPTFGFLFSVGLFFLPFLRREPKRRFAYGLTLVGVGIWYWVNHRDRYLQALLPWMACLVACVLRELWVTSQKTRLAATALVLVQVAVGAGVFAIASHVMIPGRHPLPHVMALVADGHLGKNMEKRFAPYDTWAFADWVRVGEALPTDATVLVHEDRLWTGLDRRVVVDEAAWQGGIRYEKAKNVQGIHQILKRYGVTHVVTGRNHPGGGDHGIRGEALFRFYLDTEARKVGTFGGLTAWELPASVADAATPQSIYLALCNRSPGTYRWDDVRTTNAPLSPNVGDNTSMAIVESGCGSPPPHFGRVLARRDNLTFFRR